MSGAARYRERDEAWDNLCGTYGCVTLEALSRVLFDGKPCGHVARRKVDDGLNVIRSRLLFGGISVVQLSAKGCMGAGVPVRRAEPPSGNNLDLQIAVLSFCIFGPHRRFLLRYPQAKDLVGSTLAAAPHVLMTPAEIGRYVLMRVIFTRSTAAGALKQLSRHLEKLSAIPQVAAQAGSNGSYGVAILTPTREAVASFDASIERTSLRKDHFIHVERAPGAAEYTFFMRERKRANEL